MSKNVRVAWRLDGSFPPIALALLQIHNVARINKGSALFTGGFRQFDKVNYPTLGWLL